MISQHVVVKKVAKNLELMYRKGRVQKSEAPYPKPQPKKTLKPRDAKK